ncbi:restriction endonuclease subunit S [Shewanella oncorhynchi]|uniref:restriction endonuclease subunit S n=1 Tax=Shewanella TaxID=22 RepID=UPI0021DAC0EE|nr:restriction endonuclease subunit S [Shewanella sp. SM69]MCU8040419.1 restriction endonuclease subunit S [Shewanella sp. SM69]
MTIPEEFSRFPDHWDVLPFSKAVKDATSGNMKVQKGDYLESGSIPVVDQGQSFYGGYTDEESAICKSELPTIVFGDHTRAFKFIEEPFVLGADGAKVLEPLANLDKRFLFHYLKQLRIESAGYSRHFKFLKETYVPVPPLAEQKRIAAILDKADALRRKRQQAIDLADQFLRSVFLDMFGDPVTNPKGWQTKPIKDLARVVTGNTPSRQEPENYGSSIEWIKSDNINTPDHYLTEAEEFLSDAGLKKGRSVPRGSVLITCIAGSPQCIGNAAIADREVSFNQQINALVPEGEATTEYLYSVALFGKKLIQSISTNAMKGMVSKGNLEKLLVPAPPLALQEKYSETFKDFLTKRKRQVSSLSQSESLFLSLSQQAFSGQL